MRCAIALICFIADAALAQSALMVDNPAQVGSDVPHVDLSAATFVGNDIVAAKHFTDDPWPANYHRRSGENLAIGTERMQFVGVEQGWTFGAIYRQDWRLVTNADTVDAYAQSQRGDLAQQTRRYALDYDLNGFAADGLRLGHAWAMNLSSAGQLTFGIAGNLLRGRSLRQDKVNGQLTSNAGTASLTATRDLINTDMRAKSIAEADGFSDFSPAQPMDVPMGRGGSLDVGMRYTAANGAYVGIAADDLAGRIRWSQVPRLRLTVNDAQVQCVGNDCTASRIGADWTSTYESVTLRLTPRYLVEAAYPWQGLIMRARVESLKGDLFPVAGVDYALTPAWRVGLDYESRFGSVGISVNNPYFFCALRTDKPAVGSARTLGVSIGLRGYF